MTAQITQSMVRVLERLVGEVPGVVGALIASPDGFALASVPPSDRSIDDAGLAAMSAAALALSHQLSAANGPSRSAVSHHVSEHGQVMLLPIAHFAVLTMLAAAGAEARILARAGHEAATELHHLLRSGAALVADRTH